MDGNHHITILRIHLYLDGCDIRGNGIIYQIVHKIYSAADKQEFWEIKFNYFGFSAINYTLWHLVRISSRVSNSELHLR